MPWRRTWRPTPVFLTGESPWTEELGGLQSMGSQRVRHDWATKHTDKYHVVQTMEHGSALKKKKNYQAMKRPRRKFKCISLSERSQSEKAIYCNIPTVWHSAKGKTMEIGEKIRDCHGLGDKEEWTGRARWRFRAVNILCKLLLCCAQSCPTLRAHGL